jgi:hypothetical protein
MEKLRTRPNGPPKRKKIKGNKREIYGKNGKKI